MATSKYARKAIKDARKRAGGRVSGKEVSVAASPKAPAPATTTPVSKVGEKGVNSSLTGLKKTKGGDYPVYSKGSDKAAGFDKAYGAAKKAGKGTFSWEGRKYRTK